MFTYTILLSSKVAILYKGGLSMLHQKSALRVKTRSSLVCLTLAFWYSPTLFSKKLVLPVSEIMSIHSKGFSTL